MTSTACQGEAEVIMDTLKYSFSYMFQILCSQVEKVLSSPIVFCKKVEWVCVLFRWYMCGLSLVYVCTVYSMFKKYKVTNEIQVLKWHGIL